MKMIKSSINVEYVLEMWDGGFWLEHFAFDDLSEAINRMEKMKSSLPREQFRVIKCVREVVA